MRKQDYCAGCRDDFYYGHNSLGVKKCWGLKTGRVVTRFAIGFWTPMDTARNFREVKTLSCHNEPGATAFLERIPEHLRAEWKEIKQKARIVNRQRKVGRVTVSEYRYEAEG